MGKIQTLKNHISKQCEDKVIASKKINSYHVFNISCILILVLFYIFDEIYTVGKIYKKQLYSQLTHMFFSLMLIHPP